MTQILRIKGFNGWNDWYESKCITLNSLDIEGEVYENQGVVIDGLGAIQVGLVKGRTIVQSKQYHPCKISPKNEEQAIALSMLSDNSIPLSILSGVAGSGKTLLACAHAIHQFKKGNISRIVIAKSMTPVGREVGFLKGSLEEKTKPWLGPFYDNFLQCGVTSYEMDKMVDHDELEITPISFIQGRSIPNAIIIIDEVQNLEMNVVKQIITRAAENTQIILLGDQTQVFERSLKEQTLTHLINKSKHSELVASIHLSKSLRSPIADWAVENL